MTETLFRHRTKDQKILVYGANGFMGKLFTQYLISKDIKPIYASRNMAVKRQAIKNNCEFRVFEAKDSATFLKDINIVVNVASNFQLTQKELLTACIETKTHYLDISDQGKDLLNAYDFDLQAKKAEIVVMPGAGFGIVPTDIAINMAVNKIENPTSLKIAYATEGNISRGTRKTFLNNFNKSGFIVNNGILSKALVGCKSLDFEVYGMKFKALYNPWRADLISAFKTVPSLRNIEAFTAFPKCGTKIINSNRVWLVDFVLKNLIDFFPAGPSESQMLRGRTYVKAIASNDNNEKISIDIIGPDVHLFTIQCLYELVLLMSKKQTSFGVKTPASFGKGTLGRINGVRIVSKFEKNDVVGKKQLQHI